MKKLLGLALAATITVGGAFNLASPAIARDGCGAGFHRGPAGYCRPNVRRGAFVVAPRVGIFYPGRGYWTGRAYRPHRYRYRGYWRYR
jgi:hypothetical protein